MSRSEYSKRTDGREVLSRRCHLVNMDSIRPRTTRYIKRTTHRYERRVAKVEIQREMAA